MPVAVVAAIVLTAVVLIAAYVLVKRRRYIQHLFEPPNPGPVVQKSLKSFETNDHAEIHKQKTAG